MYFQGGEFDVSSDTKEDDLQHHIAFLSSMCDDCYDSVDQSNCDYSFLRFVPSHFNEEPDIEYESLDISIK